MNKVVLVISLLLVLVFTFSCSSDSGDVPTCSGEKYDTSAYRCESNELVGKCKGNDYYPAYEICNDGVIEDKFGYFTDSRDRQVYKWVKIGNQIWTAENLKFNAENSQCPRGKYVDCEIYGRLYNWSTAMAACPNGWHLPSNKEWTTLVDKVGGKEIAGTKLKAKDEGGSDEYGFSALLPNSCKEVNSEIDRAICNMVGGNPSITWWTATEYSSSYAYEWVMFPNGAGMFDSEEDKSWTSYVRCVQD
ncbi:MAG: hypothetical protein LBH25_11425 [Fibromonadaceae bacterium]|jgi:uncharacterized protein (TIGR02145 family)|nr:hypothetical protein [Fibromonadaceae bacterium]